MAKICLYLCFVCAGMDKSKITRKQSKASKHGHENQKSTKPKPEKPSLSPDPSPFLLLIKHKGWFCNFQKVIYNKKRRKGREGPVLQNPQTSTVLTVENWAPKPFTIHPSSLSYLLLKSKGFLKLKGALVNSRKLKYNGKVKWVFPRDSLAQDQAQATVKAQIYVGFVLNSLTKLAQMSHQGNDTLAILRYTQFDPTATIDDQMIEEMIGQDLKDWRARQEGLEASAWHYK
ncbi:hypothetical protein Tco_0753944 [Tanacetum coccineum]